jgi:acyl-CoA thioester hydrolase
MSEKQPFPQPEACWTHWVSYGETDAMGVAYYGNYLHWFEQARSHFLREFKASYADIEAAGIFLPVREAFCRYRSPARYDQQIAIRTGISVWGRASLTFDYEISNLSMDNALMSRGYTQHACINSSGRPVAVPQWLKDIFLTSPDQSDS